MTTQHGRWCVGFVVAQVSVVLFLLVAFELYGLARAVWWAMRALGYL